MNETGETRRRGWGGSSSRKAAGFEPLGLKAGQGFRAAVDAAVRRMEKQGRLAKAAKSPGIWNTPRGKQ